ncbi:CvpA family protein [Flavisphingomonas formosensis]|uniref:CvpA family protein n=1 Tax=Flavisphingomonas formosensis TaxID=861534 RepID=UPI0012F9ABD7|nr:CvpA family protein [Sphingomonas formosensis]
MPPLTTLDIIVFVLVGGGAALGLMRGFVSEVLSLIVWIVIVLVLKIAHAPLTGVLTGPVNTGTGASVLAFVIIVVMMYVAGRMAANAIGDSVRQSVLGPIDRVLGFGFGALKGLLIAALLYLLANLGVDLVYGSNAKRPDWMRASRTYALLNASSRAIVDFVEARRHHDPLPRADKEREAGR